MAAYIWRLCCWSHVTGEEINQPVPFNFNFRAWCILWSPVSGGACALQREAEWMLITLDLLPRALHPSSIRHTRTGGHPRRFAGGGRTGSRSSREGTLLLLPRTAELRRLTLWPWRVKDARLQEWEETSEGGLWTENRWHLRQMGGVDLPVLPRWSLIQTNPIFRPTRSLWNQKKTSWPRATAGNTRFSNICWTFIFI